MDNKDYSTKTTTSLSEDTRENFVMWLQNWDDRISNMDDRHRMETIEENLRFCIGKINLTLSESDKKAMSKFKSDEDMVKALYENQKKSWYKDFVKISNYLNVLIFNINDIYELKNRKAFENIKLRAEIAKSRSKN